MLEDFYCMLVRRKKDFEGRRKISSAEQLTVLLP
jgi:hypothetical protein